MCTNTFLYKKYILRYPNFNKYPVSTEHPKNGVGSVWALKVLEVCEHLRE